MRSLALLSMTAGVLVLASGCAHTRSPSEGANESETVTEVLKSNQATRLAPTTGTSRITSAGEIIIQGIKLQNTRFDYPVTINSRVEHWVDYFTGRGRKHFARYLERSELFVPYIVPILRQNGMPEDLVYLAMIESGFNNHARSHAKAVGPWQFISATGKRYGLMVNWWVDERRDTRKSTLAAIQYLKELNEMFQSWELAAAAYNAGEAKVARAIRRYGSKDFWTLARHRFFRPETRDYVPKIIAAALVAKNRTQFGFPPPSETPHQGEAVAGDGEIVKVVKEGEGAPAASNRPTPAAAEPGDSIAKLLAAQDLSEETVETDEVPEITPASLALNQDSAAIPGAPLTSEPLAKPVPTPHVSKNGEVVGEELAEFEVQSPADLLKVARAAGLAYQTVKSLNPELLRWCTPPTVSTYRIKLPSSVKDKFLVAYNHISFPKKVEFLGYKVQQGETISRIASRFGIKVDPISDLNGISSKVPLRKGLKILLPMPEDRSRSLASLEVRDPPEKKRRRRRGRHSSLQRISFERREAARATPHSFSPTTSLE